MPRSEKQLLENYKACYNHISKLLEQQFRQKGLEFDKTRTDSKDLIYTVLGHHQVAGQLSAAKYRRDKMETIIIDCINEVYKLFYPDVKRRGFVSIDAIQWDLQELISDAEEPVLEPDSTAFAGRSNPPSQLTAGIWSFKGDEVKNHQMLSLGDENKNRQRLQKCQTDTPVLYRRYLQEIIKRCPWINETKLSGLLGSMEKLDSQKIKAKLKLTMELYPDGNIANTAELDASQKLSAAEIINCYKNVYLGLDSGFPKYFLQRDAEYRSKIIIRFLVNNILKKDVQSVYQEIDDTFFIRHKVLNIFRYFNYSANRTLMNAFPREIRPWLSTKIPLKYWKNKENRAAAVRWLVEQKLNCDLRNLKKSKLKRAHFYENGLSFLFNRYYNSVAKALAEAYPHLHPWQLGNVPLKFWTDEKAAMAIRWIVQQKNWNKDTLPDKIKKKEFSSSTFSEYGLTTLFNRKFNKNFFAVLNCAWPGEFNLWEVGRVKAAFWQKRKNIFHISAWVAKQEGIEKKAIAKALKQKELDIEVLKKHSFGAALHKICQGKVERLFAPFIWQEHEKNMTAYRNLQRIKQFIEKEKIKNNLRNLLLYGLFVGFVRRSNNEYAFRLERIARRMQRNMHTG